MLEQISIFAENKKGMMNNITNVLAQGGINIDSMLTNDSGEFGTIRLLVDDTQKAVQSLTDAGYQCRVDKVIGVYMVDEVGGLNRILGDILQSNININYIYITFDREQAAPIAVMRTESYAEVEECLRAKGYKVC